MILGPLAATGAGTSAEAEKVRDLLPTILVGFLALNVAAGLATGGGRELLPDALRAAGCTVETLSAYRRALPRPDAALTATLAELLATPNDWIVTSSEALRGLVAIVSTFADPASVAGLQRQHLIVPHARIAETARALGFGAVTLTGSGDERLLAALQS